MGEKRKEEQAMKRRRTAAANIAAESSKSLTPVKVMLARAGKQWEEILQVKEPPIGTNIKEAVQTSPEFRVVKDLPIQLFVCEQPLGDSDTPAKQISATLGIPLESM